MSYFGTGGSNDAFGRQRVSDTGQRLDVEFIYDKQEDFFDEITNGASAAITLNGNPRDLTLSVGTTTNGEYATMRSHPVPYTPGNSQLIDMTGVLDLAGIGGGTAQFFIRTSISGSAIETATDQADWTALTSDVDWTDSHFFQIDFQSLKVGTIRFLMIANGVPTQVGQIDNDNVRNSGYWQLASLPAYYRIYNDATYTYMEIGYGDEANAVGFRYRITANASATMKAICCTVKSEGGVHLQNMPGLPRAIHNGITAVTASTTRVPILSIRPKSTYQTYPNLGIALPKGFSVQTTEAIRVDVIHNGALTTPSFADVDTNHSMMEYDVAATGITNGHVVFSQYIHATSSGPASTRAVGNVGGLLGKTVLWNRQGSETGIFSICATRTGASDASVFAALDWQEIR